MTAHEIQWASVDPLGEALHSLHLAGTFYCYSELSRPWGLSMPAMPACLWFHAAVAGGFVISSDSFHSVNLEPGDFLLVPAGAGHRLRSEPGVSTPDVLQLPHEMTGDRYAHLKHGGGGATDRLVCGVVRFNSQMGRDLVSHLPTHIHIRAHGAAGSEWLASTLELMAAETRCLTPGSEALVTRLADVLVIQAVRHWLEYDPAARKGWIGALKEKKIGRALALIHRTPEADWTVAKLAAAAAMSRSGFAARFTQLVGEGPMQYLTRVRIRTAQQLLATGEAGTIGAVAARVGYQSQAAFARAFKKLTGVAPGSMREVGQRWP